MKEFKRNFILLTDSYKQTHDPLYPDEVETVGSYMEARLGAEYDFMLFNGLQPQLMKYFEGVVITREDIEEAAATCAWHFGDETKFNRKMWEYILNECGGKLPIRIKAVKEGTRMPINQAFMVMENIGGKITRGLVSHCETILTHIWYPITVATKSRYIKDILEKYGKICGFEDIDFHCHDFGFRGVSSVESSEVGGTAHLINFLGTDTMSALPYIKHFYGMPSHSGFSVVASEHSVATSGGEEREIEYLDHMLDVNPNDIVSCVADTYKITRFVTEYIPSRKQRIIDRCHNNTNPGLHRFVVRPDSPRFKGDTPWEQCLWLHEELSKTFGHTVNDKGFKVLDTCVGVIYGDGLSTAEIEEIYAKLIENGWSISNMVVGQGGGLLQKLNRDTLRFAIKCSYQIQNGALVDIQKKPLDMTKASKKGQLKLVKNYDIKGNWEYETINQHHPLYFDFADEMEVVFEMGEMKRIQTFPEIRELSNQ
jgi:nicotinamide phosphoribosyltransferase